MANFEINAAMVDVPVKGGAFKAYRTVPEGAGPQPGVIVVHDFRGLSDHTRDITERITKAGYLGLAVDLFSRSEKLADPNDMQALWDRMMNLSDADAVEDLMAAERYLHGIPQVAARRVGVIGFCMGGLYAYLLACSDDMVHAAVDFYGSVIYESTSPAKPISPIERASNLRCPLLGFFGEEDAMIPVEHARQFEERLGREEKEFEIHTYPDCGHAFFNDTRDSYHAPAAEDAWDKTLRFFTKHLRF
jgi:carboxymethylenebutenolidase